VLTCEVPTLASSVGAVHIRTKNGLFWLCVRGQRGQTSRGAGQCCRHDGLMSTVT